MTSPILFAGGEDMDVYLSSGLVSVGTSGISINTTAGYFRSGYARYGLSLVNNQNPAVFTQNIKTLAWTGGTATTFWTSAQIGIFFTSGSASNTQAGTGISWQSSDGVTRLRIRNPTAGVSAANMPPCTCVVEKITAAGGVTQLGSSFTMWPFGTLAKIDVSINYAVSGSFQVYQSGVQIFSYSGDVTTDSMTALAAVTFGSIAQVALGLLYNVWSEMIVSTRDTRNMSCVTQAPAGAGNTDAWTGTYTQVNGNTAGDVSPNYVGTAAQVQEYTVSALPAGTYGVVTVVTTLRATMGITGPTKINAMVRTGGVDYKSADIPLTLAWQRITNNWDLNPNTSAAWQPSDLNAVGFNLGFNSVT